MIARMSPHERDARSRGIPSQGSGVVFPISEDAYKIEPFPIPRHWPQLAAIDLGGYDHPFAGARIAIDRDADCIYVTHVYCVKGQPLHAHAAALRSWGKGLPFAWPHDAMQHDRTSGQRFSDLLREHGLEMLPERVTFPDGGNGLEAGVAEMLDRKMTGRLKVFSTCEQYFKEARDFHRRDGRINPIDDDCIAAVRYSVMGERFAIPPTEFGGASNWSQPLLRGIRRLA